MRDAVVNESAARPIRAVTTLKKSTASLSLVLRVPHHWSQLPTGVRELTFPAVPTRPRFFPGTAQLGFVKRVLGVVVLRSGVFGVLIVVTIVTVIVTVILIIKTLVHVIRKLFVRVVTRRTRCGGSLRVG